MKVSYPAFISHDEDAFVLGIPSALSITTSNLGWSTCNVFESANKHHTPWSSFTHQHQTDRIPVRPTPTPSGTASTVLEQETPNPVLELGLKQPHFSLLFHYVQSHANSIVNQVTSSSKLLFDKKWKHVPWCEIISDDGENEIAKNANVCYRNLQRHSLKWLFQLW